MSLPSDVTVDNFKDFYTMILPYLNVGNGGTSDTPLGQVAFFDDLVAPYGWLVADGTVYNISDYPDLANQYERVHGSKNFYGGNGTTTFAVPDWQGEFLRASGTNSHANQGSGAAVGVHQDGTIHFLNRSGDITSLALNTTTDVLNLDTMLTIPRNRVSKSSSDSDGVAYTARPTNTSLLCCVKAVPSSEMNTYSTTERRVGTWIDGKPVYQKTFTSGFLNNLTNGWTNELNKSAIDDIEGFIYCEACAQLTGTNACSSGQARVYGDYIQIYVAGWDQVALAALTLRYTKTTD